MTNHPHDQPIPYGAALVATNTITAAALIAAIHAPHPASATAAVGLICTAALTLTRAWLRHHRARAGT